MQEKPTYEIEKLLETLSPNQLDEFLKNNKDVADDKKGFYYYMKDIAESKNIFLKDMYSFAGVSEKYGEKIIRMEKHTTNRDLIIRFCVAGHFSVLETNRALKLYGMKSLYVKDKRDAALSVAINNRVYDLAQIDDMLLKLDLTKLSADE